MQHFHIAGVLIHVNCSVYQIWMSTLSTWTKKSLSQTFRDAIEVAKAMSIPYLWTDALCTIQDSKQDKLEESLLL